MQRTLRLKRELFSIISWRMEARASVLAPEQGQRIRDRAGHLMRWARAHDSLPKIADRAAILCFHGVVGHPPDPEVECEHLSVRAFRQLLRVLARSFQVISLAELVACVQSRNSPPPRSVVITFDDGYANNVEVAAAELARFRMPWSAFLPVQLVETGNYQWIDDIRLLVHRGGRRELRLPDENGPLHLDLSTSRLRHAAVRTIHQRCRYVPDEVRGARLAAVYECFPVDRLQELRAQFHSFRPMNWHQARQLKAAGVDVGSHSLTHTALGPQPAEVVRREVFSARDLLARQLGSIHPHFSYPYGRCASISQQTQCVLAEAGYNCALTLEEDAVRCSEVDQFRLPRLIVSPLVGRIVFNLWQRFVR